MTKQQKFWRELGLVTLAYLGLTLVITWPLVVHLVDGVAGFEGRDSLQWVWFNWWGVKSILALQTTLAQVDWLYFPQGGQHPILWATAFVPMATLPVTLAGGPKLAYNLMILASFVLGGILTYLLARVLVRRPQAAFVAGIIFIFAPNRMGHLMGGQLLLIVTWTFPLLALSVTYLFRRPSWRWAVVGGLTLTMLTLTQPLHLAYFALPLATIYGGGLFLEYVIYSAKNGRLKSALQSWWPYGLGVVGLAAGLLLPFYLPLLSAAWRGQTNFSNEGLLDHSTDLLAFILPSPFHPLWSQPEAAPALLTRIIDSPRDLEERLAYVGLLPLGLSIWAILRRWSQVRLWLLLAVVAAVLSLGPTLQVLKHDTGLPLPYAGLMNLPFLSWSRTPGRFNETVSLALALIVAFGLSDILARWPRWQQRWLTLGVTAFILFEYLVFLPFPVGGHIVPDFYRRLAIVAPGQPLLDMPVTGSRRASNYSLLYQTLHDRPIAGGYILREWPDTEEMKQFFDRLLSPSPAAMVVAGMPSIKVRQQILRDLGIEQVVARRWLMTDRAATETLEFMPSVLGSAYYVSDDLLAWQPPPVDAPLPDYTLLLSEDGWETSGDGTRLDLKAEGLLFVYATQPGPATLTLDLEGTEPDQMLWVNDAGPLPTTGTDLSHRLHLVVQQGFNWLAFRLSDCDGCRVTFSRIALEGGRVAAP